MTRILLAGVGPRPGSGSTRVYAPGLRLETFARVLVDAGHEVHGLEAAFAGAADALPAPMEGAASWRSTDLDPDRAAESISEAARRLRPDALIASTDAIGLAAARSAFDGPLLVDYNGHPMAERQMLAHAHGSDEGLLGQWLDLVPVLLRADKFATCSRAQRLALIGELGAAGRLGGRTAGHEFVLPLTPASAFDAPFVHSGAPLLRGSVVPEDGRILLFAGGYNTWQDIRTLFDAVERVLAADPKAHYASTGGAIDGHVSVVFEQFRAMADASPHRDRYHFVGWLEHDRFVDACLEADVGVSADLPTLEGELGCRNRMYAWLWAGMRVVVTELSEITRDLAVLDSFRAVPVGEPEGLARALLDALQAGRLDDEAAEAVRDGMREHFAPSRLLAPLVEWAADPTIAPDREAGGLPRNPLAEAMASFGGDAGRIAAARELAARIRGSRLLRLWLRRNPDAERLLRILKD